MKKIDFSIIIPTWNRSTLVRELLKSLYEDRNNYQYGATEVLIIDNSEGEEKKIIQTACSDYEAQYIEGTASVRQKRNKGIDMAKYEYILFVDSDVTVKLGLLTQHAQAYLQNHEMQQLGGTFGLTEFVGDKKFWFKVIELTTFVDSFGFAKQFPFVSWTIGNNVSFKKRVLLEIGKFEENLPFKLGGDDLDMTYRVTKKGYLIKTVPEAVTYHSRETWNSWKAVNDRSKRWGTMEYYILKRHPELVHRRLPMTGDLVLVMLIVFGLMAAIRQSMLPLLFYGIWCILLYFLMYGHYVRKHGMANILYWTIAMAMQGKYRFHRLLISLKEKDLSLAFKGQFFGIYHIRSDFKATAEKTWLYYVSLFLIILIMGIYKLLNG